MTTCRLLALVTLAVGMAGCSGEDGAAGPMPTVAIGGGLMGTGEATSPLAVDYGGGGSAATVARSDHGHADIGTLQATVASHATGLAALTTSVGANTADILLLKGNAAAVGTLVEAVFPANTSYPTTLHPATTLTGCDTSTCDITIGAQENWDGPVRDWGVVTLTAGTWLLTGTANIQTYNTASPVNDWVYLAFMDMGSGAVFGVTPGGVTAAAARSVSATTLLTVGTTPVDVRLRMMRNGISWPRAEAATWYPAASLRAVRIK